MKEKIMATITPIIQRIRRIDYIIFYNYYKVREKVDANKILMLSDSRDSLSGNLQYIYDELINYDYTIKVLLNKFIKDKKNFKDKKKLMYEIATSKYIVIDDFYPIIYPLKLRKNVKLIQVWHAMGAFKKMGFSRIGKPGGPVSTSLTHKNYTDAIVSSESIRKDYAEAFGISISSVHAIGIPRTDMFFDSDIINSKKEELYKKYPTLKNKTVITYAPTFRGKGQQTAYFDTSIIDFDFLKKELSDEYIFVIKMHPFVRNVVIPNDDFFIDLSDEREINDLLLITDILITDYSSVIFEYSLLDKKMIFYVPDIDDYIDKRDFYYPFEKYIYGDVAKSTNELISCINKEFNGNYRIEEFREFFCSACDGKSTKRFVEELIIKNR